MALQQVGTNSADSNLLLSIMDLNDQLDKIPKDKRGPVLHGLAVATGIITLGQGAENSSLLQQLKQVDMNDDVNAVQGLLLGLGLSNFGMPDFMQSEAGNMVIQMISAESETIRRAACLCLALTCFQ